MKEDPITWLVNMQENSSSSRFFATYKAVPWVPHDANVVESFKRACVDETGGIILYDIVDAINTISPGSLNTRDLVPRSKYHPDMIRPQCEQLENGGRMANYDKDVLQRAWTKVRKMFRMSNLKPLELGEVPYDPSTNAGLPTLQKKADVYPMAVQSARKVVRGKRPQPCVAFHRGKNLEKARMVMGYPFEMTLLEGRFFYPYQAEIITHHTPYVGGRYDFETAGLINEIAVKSSFYYELDYSQFDSSISRQLIKMAFSIIRDSFDMTDEDAKVFNLIENYFIYTPVLMPDGMIYFGKEHGVPSGSNFTQIIDSIVNCICVEYVNITLGMKAKRYYVLGDDVIMGSNSKRDLGEMSAQFAILGIKLNTEKSKVKVVRLEEPHFLGHEWQRLIAVRSREETLARLVTPERARNEYWSNSKEVRTQAYIERIKSYQDDNMREFLILQELIMFYRSPSSAKRDWWWYRSYRFVNQDMDNFYLPSFNPWEERKEVRWKHNKAFVHVGSHRGVSVFL